MSDCISKDEILSPDDYGFLYGQLEYNKIPADIYDKIMEGDEFTEEEERRIKDIIEKEKAKIQEERKKGIKECWCDSCEYCEGYLHKTRKSFICNHPDYEYIRKYFKEHNIRKMEGFIGFGEKFSDIPKNKTTPRWCPENCAERLLRKKQHIALKKEE